MTRPAIKPSVSGLKPIQGCIEIYIYIYIYVYSIPLYSIPSLMYTWNPVDGIDGIWMSLARKNSTESAHLQLPSAKQLQHGRFGSLLRCVPPAYWKAGQFETLLERRQVELRQLTLEYQQMQVGKASCTVKIKLMLASAKKYGKQKSR